MINRFYYPRMASNYLRAYPSRAILLAILDLGSAQNPHVLRVRSGFLRAVRVQTGCANNAWWDRLLVRLRLPATLRHANLFYGELRELKTIPPRLAAGCLQGEWIGIAPGWKFFAYSPCKATRERSASIRVAWCGFGGGDNITLGINDPAIAAIM